MRWRMAAARQKTLTILWPCIDHDWPYIFALSLFARTGLPESRWKRDADLDSGRALIDYVTGAALLVVGEVFC